MRVWGEGRGNPSAVGLTGLAATWSYIYRVYEGLFCPFYLLPPTSSSFNLCALTNPALLATGRGCVAMWQGDRPVSVPPVLLLESILVSESISRVSPPKYLQQLSKKQILAAWKDYGKAVVLGLCGCS